MREDDDALWLDALAGRGAEGDSVAAREARDLRARILARTVADPPPVPSPAARVASRLASPAVSHADRMTRSASSLRSNISLKLRRPSEPEVPKEVSSAGRAGHPLWGGVTRP